VAVTVPVWDALPATDPADELPATVPCDEEAGLATTVDLGMDDEPETVETADEEPTTVLCDAVAALPVTPVLEALPISGADDALPDTVPCEEETVLTSTVDVET